MRTGELGASGRGLRNSQALRPDLKRSEHNRNDVFSLLLHIVLFISVAPLGANPSTKNDIMWAESGGLGPGCYSPVTVDDLS